MKPGQLCEHLKPDALARVLNSGHSWDVTIITGGSLSATHVRIDRVKGGYLVHHGKYRDLKAIDPNV